MTSPRTTAVRLGALRLRSPLVLASGVLGVSADAMGFAARHGAAAVTTKSCSVAPRAGHPTPIVHPFAGGLVNAVGLSNPGAAAMADEIRALQARHPALPIIASVFAGEEAGFAAVTAILAEATPDAIEINVSCPNVAAEFGTPFALDPEATRRITRAVKDAAGAIPVATKLSPASPALGDMARAAADGGADWITAINTAGPGMLIDVGMRRPILSNRVGGVSGPAILPIAVKAVWDVARAVDLPIIGTGGVSTAEDALQLIMAGATAVGIGSAVYSEGVEVFARVAAGLEAFMAREGLSSLHEIRGCVHG